MEQIYEKCSEKQYRSAEKFVKVSGKIIRFAVIFLGATCLLFNICRAQDKKIIRNGNNFSAAKTERTVRRDSTATPYTYTDRSGVEYHVYLSKSGKAFIPKVSKNGKYYRQYMPEITAEISK